MNQVKELYDLALDVPAPALPEVSTVISAAKRQNRYVTAGSGVAALAADPSMLPD